MFIMCETTRQSFDLSQYWPKLLMKSQNIQGKTRQKVGGCDFVLIILPTANPTSSIKLPYLHWGVAYLITCQLFLGRYEYLVGGRG